MCTFLLHVHDTLQPHIMIPEHLHFILYCVKPMHIYIWKAEQQQNIHTIPDPWPWINNCLEQWSERVYRVKWVTLPFNRSGEKEWNRVQHHWIHFKQGKLWQRPCIEIGHVKKLWKCYVNTSPLFEMKTPRRACCLSCSGCSATTSGWTSVVFLLQWNPVRMHPSCPRLV